MSKTWENIIGGLAVFLMGMVGDILLLFKFGIGNQYVAVGLMVGAAFMIVGFLTSLFAVAKLIRGNESQ